MHERESARRRKKDRDGEPSRRQAIPSSAEAALAVQRGAGNQALVQRLLWNSRSSNLMAPPEYANQRVPWDKKAKLAQDRPPLSTDPTLFELAQDIEFKPVLSEGLGVTWVNDVKSVPPDRVAGGVKPFADETLKPNQRPLYNLIAAEIASIAAAENRLVEGDMTKPFNTLVGVGTNSHLVPRLKDMLPQVPDLPGADVSLTDTLRPDGSGFSFWTFACVLIAIYKQEGIAAISAFTGRDFKRDDIKLVVQALHDHYIRAGVQYDDSSQRKKVMGDWGYKLAFSGDADWSELPEHVDLPTNGAYIFDLQGAKDGHTVKVTVEKPITMATAALPATQIDTLADFFTCESDADNFNPGHEFQARVQYIWKK